MTETKINERSFSNPTPLYRKWSDSGVGSIGVQNTVIN